MNTHTLLIELCCEELPPKALKGLGESFCAAVESGLRRERVWSDSSKAVGYATPRRLAAQVTAVTTEAPGQTIAHKLMPVAVGLTAEGLATPALVKKLAALGHPQLAVDALRREADGKAEWLWADIAASPVPIAVAVQRVLEAAIAALPIPKVMTYQLADGWSDVKFVRPVHRLVVLHGAQVLPVRVLGLSAGRETLAHRFEAGTPELALVDADSYTEALRDRGRVIASFSERQAVIRQQMQAATQALGADLAPIEDAALLDEVTALVEWPNVLIGTFEERFLAVPQECLILTMKANQKYFPLLKPDGTLSNRFLIVANIAPNDTRAIIAGNERVVRPRLADAEFFFNTDRKTALAARLVKLESVVYHNQLGSQRERIERLAVIARAIAEDIGADAHLAHRAARLAKADLTTDMVGEFPELQGIMGRYYALSDGEPADVADAIAEHYRPRFAGDALPASKVALAVALADKLETLVGIFGIGQKPSGDKDPYALRRAALGVIRMLIETPLALDLRALIDVAAGAFACGLVAGTTQEVFGFMQERLRFLLREQGIATQTVEAVVGQQSPRYDQVPARLAAVQAFQQLPESEALAAANKRVLNILKKSGAAENIQSSLLAEPAEKQLAASLAATAPRVRASLEAGDYAAALMALAALRGGIDAFFDQVLVNAEDPALRRNRLALLTELGKLLNAVADISRLA
jgi:glycyl-tRNA synthetase beta chain